eukprot:911302-Karenia_brevis.AAC.1
MDPIHFNSSANILTIEGMRQIAGLDTQGGDGPTEHHPHQHHMVSPGPLGPKEICINIKAARATGGAPGATKP